MVSHGHPGRAVCRPVRADRLSRWRLRVRDRPSRIASPPVSRHQSASRRARADARTSLDYTSSFFGSAEVHGAHGGAPEPLTWLLDVARDGISLTQTGALSQALVRAAVERFPGWWNAELFGPPHREDEVRALCDVHDLTRRMRLLRRRGRVLTGVSGSLSARHALTQAIAIAQASHGRLGLLGAAPKPPLAGWAQFFVPPISPSCVEEHVEAEIARRLDQAEREVPSDVAVTKLVAHADPAEALITHARDGPWDVLVVGRSPCSKRALLGRDVGAKLLRSSPVPVLIVPGS